MKGVGRGDRMVEEKRPFRSCKGTEGEFLDDMYQLPDAEIQDSLNYSGHLTSF